MPRPRQFDEADALARMVRVFWEHGYDGATMRMLEQATGVGVRGIANVFGDKDAIFLKALELYAEMARRMIEQLFDPPGLASIEALFSSLSEPKPLDDPANLGCLMVNTVFGLARTDAPARASVAAYREMWRATFERALVAEGRRDARARSEFLVNLLWGALAQIRLARDAKAAAPMTAVAIETVRGWARE